jgi:hypothetical protein
MKEEKLNELLHLYVLDELSGSEKTELEEYLENSESARRELENLQNLFNTLSANRPADVNEDMLITSRQNVMRQIRIEETRESILTKILQWFDLVSVNGYRLAASTASAVVIGVLIGFLIFNRSTIETSVNSSQETINIDNILKNGRSLSNIRFDTDPVSGSVEISFDAVKSLTYNGSMDDEVVKSLLAAALLNNKNPGSRLRTVNTLVEQTTVIENQDPKIKTALITSLKNDSNPAVRKAALEALKNFKYDKDIRDVILYVLSNDTNSGLRVNAINTLAGLKIDGISIDDKIRNELNNQLTSEENGFIKYRAAALLEGED